MDKDFCGKYHSEIIKYYINALSRRVLKKNLFEQHYCKEVLMSQQGNDAIRKMIASGQPFMAGRFGGNEIRALSDVIFEKSGGRCGGLSKRSRSKLVNQAGFFPDEKEMFYRFADVYLDACKEVDMIGVWNMFLQGEITKKYLPDATYTELRAIEPYYYESPWSEALKGKKVLVIHPFAETIQEQYIKREKIFPGTDILPEFELLTIKAVQTIAGQKDERYATWFDALEDMHQQTKKLDYDIALVGCGAYGFPLAAKIKADAKQVVHMGGSLQILFGIKGKRWDDHEYISKLYNDAWTRPSDKDKVQKSEVVEGSCYW